MKKKSLRLIICSVHAVFLLIATSYWQSWVGTRSDEAFLIQSTMIVNKLLLGIDPKPKADEWLFVNTSWSNQLVDKLDNDGFPVGNSVITDRKQLTDFALKLKKYQDYHIVLLDIFFEHETNEDSALSEALKDLPRLRASVPSTDSGTVLKPVVQVKTAVSSYAAMNDQFLKFRLCSDTLFTTPIALWQDVSGEKWQPWWVFMKDQNGRLHFNQIALDWAIRQHDLENHRFPKVNLSDLLVLPDSVFHSYIKKRRIIVGDFEAHDFHNTVLGSQPGPLILANAFLTIESGKSYFHPVLIIFLLTLYTLLGFYVFYPDNKVRMYLQPKMNDYLIYVISLTATSILSYMIFSVHLNILLVGTYLYFLEKGLNFFRVEILGQKE